MNLAMAYIEEHLDDEIDFTEVERLALCSEYHFRRMFSYLAGISLSEYIRRRRLTLAAFELQNHDTRVLDTAVKYGYGSADSFARAFTGLHGMTPSEARQSGQTLKAYPRMTFQLTVKGVAEMNYRIVEKEGFAIVGLMRRVPLVYEGVNPHIAEMTSQLTEELIRTLKGLSNVEPRGIISASTHFAGGREEGSEIDHYIGVATTHPAPDGLAELAVPPLTWAVFESVGPFPQTMQSTWARIFSEWLPASGYQLVPGPEMLWNESPDTSSPSYRSEIWIPVGKR